MMKKLNVDSVDVWVVIDDFTGEVADGKIIEANFEIGYVKIEDKCKKQYICMLGGIHKSWGVRGRVSEACVRHV